MGSMEDAFRKAGVAPPVAEPPPEKACARCGKTFQPARPQHKLCEECATAMRTERTTEQKAPARAAAVEGEKPAAEIAPESPGAAAAAAPAAARPRLERPPRRERPPAPAQLRPEALRRPPFAAVRGLPDRYLEHGYFGSGGALRPELLTTWAEQIAHSVATGPAEPTSQQLRAFNNHVRRAVDALRYGGKPFAEVLAEVQKMRPIAAERAARRKISEHFRQFLDANLERVADQKALLAFAAHLRAVAAYADSLLHSRKDRR